MVVDLDEACEERSGTYSRDERSRDVNGWPQTSTQKRARVKHVTYRGLFEKSNTKVLCF